MDEGTTLFEIQVGTEFAIEIEKVAVRKIESDSGFEIGIEIEIVKEDVHFHQRSRPHLTLNP
jgi:hypothetical protein